MTDLVELARDAEVPVWYTRDPHREDDPEWGIWGRRAEEGARGWEFVDELEPGRTSWLSRASLRESDGLRFG